jgi:hypothetical protein
MYIRNAGNVVHKARIINITLKTIGSMLNLLPSSQHTPNKTSLSYFSSIIKYCLKSFPCNYLILLFGYHPILLDLFSIYNFLPFLSHVIFL